MGQLHCSADEFRDLPVMPGTAEVFRPKLLSAPGPECLYLRVFDFHGSGEELAEVVHDAWHEFPHEVRGFGVAEFQLQSL